MKKAVIAKIVLVSVVFATSLFAQTPDPDKVYIKRITYAGPGCPHGSVVHNISVDAKAFTLLFDSFFAEIGPDLPSGHAKNSCVLKIDLRFPQGWSYTIFDVDYRGYASLDEGVRATHSSKYFYQSNPGDYVRFSRSAVGPFDDDYLISDSIGLSELVWSPCGRYRALNIETKIALNNSSNSEGYGTITIDSIDGELSHIYGIKWMRCY